MEVKGYPMFCGNRRLPAPLFRLIPRLTQCAKPRLRFARDDFRPDKNGSMRWIAYLLRMQHSYGDRVLRPQARWSPYDGIDQSFARPNA
jgi:hypothetical protein